MLRIFKSRRGTSLIDLMVTLALLTVAGIIFATAYPTAFRCSRQATGYKIATTMAQRKLEQLRAMNYESLQYPQLISAGIIDSDSSSSPYSFTSTDSLSSQLTNATGVIMISDDSAVIKKVTVTITWTDNPTSVNRSVSVTTLFTDKRTRKVS